MASTRAAHQRPRGGLKVAVTGASGFVGSGLMRALAAAGHKAVPLARSGPGPHWRPDRPEWHPGGAVDAVAHLAGEPIGQRWSAAVRRRIRQSRVEGTRNLCAALAADDRPPATLVCASAVGWYGDTGDRGVRAGDPPGQGFLADVVQQWEAAADAARDAGIRVVHLRQGVVLDPQGGALARMLVPFRLGLGGRVGSGRQWFPWVAYDDVVDAWVRALEGGPPGVRDLVSPGIVTQRDFARALGLALRRSAFMPLPAWVVRAVWGRMGQEVLLWGQRVQPGDPECRHPDMDEWLDRCLQRAA